MPVWSKVSYGLLNSNVGISSKCFHEMKANAMPTGVSIVFEQDL